MAYTEAQLKRINYLRSSVRLQAPNIETDPAYKFTDDELYAILSVVTPTHNPIYTIETLPDTEFNFVNMLGKKEIYYRLATSTAPFYPLSAEGASLQKNVRFDHYMSLLSQTEKDYNNAVKLAQENQFGEIYTVEQLAQGRHFTKRNYNLAKKTTVLLETSGVTITSVNLDWTKFDSGLFDTYKVYVETEPIIDEYAETPLRGNLVAKFFTADIHKLKVRISGLNPDTTYYVCVVSLDRTGLYGYSEKQVRTLPLS